jgi:hypothetical protein
MKKLGLKTAILKNEKGWRVRAKNTKKKLNEPSFMRREAKLIANVIDVLITKIFIIKSKLKLRKNRTKSAKRLLIFEKKKIKKRKWKRRNAPNAEK